MCAGAAIAIVLSRAVGSADVALREEGIADTLASGVEFVDVCSREAVIVHVSQVAAVDENVPWSASQGDRAPRQSVRDWAARGPASIAQTDAVRSLV